MAITRATNIAGLGTVFDALTDGGGLSISGLSTFTDLNVTGAVDISAVNVTGVTTTATLVATAVSVTSGGLVAGIATVNNINTTQLNVTGVTTAGIITSTSIGINTSAGSIAAGAAIHVVGFSQLSGTVNVGQTNQPAKIQFPAVTGWGPRIAQGEQSINDLGIFTNNIENFTVKNDGSVGIGTNVPIGKLNVYGGSNDPYVYVQRNTTSAQDIGGYSIRNASTTIASIIGRASNSNSGFIQFFTATGGTQGERLRILSSGGITFNGDTAADNTLDDYEEGTWTPANTYQSLTNNLTARYVKIGDFVTVWGDCTCSSLSDSSQTGGYIEGLPFTVSGELHVTSFKYFQPGTGSYPYLAAYQAFNNTNTYIRASDGGTTAFVRTLNDNRVLTRSETANCRYIFSFSYRST